MILKEKLAAQIPAWRERVGKLVQESGDVKVDQINVRQIYGGIRGVKCLVTDISFVDPNEGIRLRGFTIPQLLEKLPKPEGSDMPYVGGLYYLLLLGEIPTQEEALEVEAEWKRRWDVPEYVDRLLRTLPEDSHPMTMFSQAILALQRESSFAKRYLEGMRKEEYWEPMLEDSLDLTAKAPAIAAHIYQLKYGDGKPIAPDQSLDWAANFAHMMKIQDPEYKDLARLYMIIHSDHESGNVSAHATYLVSSTLADIYYSTSAGMNGLAGPLHGLANQQSLSWLMGVYNRFNGVPSKDQLRQYAEETLDAGQVIPGYGHAVLRTPDPRYTAQYRFAERHMPDDEIFRLAVLVKEVVPDVLLDRGKAKNPWPNVDAISGTLQQHYGVKDCSEKALCGFYTVMFGVSRLLGVSANVIWARALMEPIERPKSVTTPMLEEIVAKAKEAAGA